MEPNGSGGEVDGGKEIPGGWRSPGIRRELVDLAKRYERRGEARMAPAMISAPGRVSRTRRLRAAVRNCTRDEGGPFEAGSQVQVSSHRELLSSRAMVVSVAETSGHDPGRQG